MEISFQRQPSGAPVAQLLHAGAPEPASFESPSPTVPSDSFKPGNAAPKKKTRKSSKTKPSSLPAPSTTSSAGAATQERNILPAELVAAQPLPPGSHTMTIKLDDPSMGKFAGAKVSTQLSGQQRGLVADSGEANKLQDQTARLVKMGEIKYTAPGQVVTTADLIKPDGSPYTGVVRYKDGQMTIERVDLFD